VPLTAFLRAHRGNFLRCYEETDAVVVVVVVVNCDTAVPLDGGERTT
jgi:hypothetical protein